MKKQYIKPAIDSFEFELEGAFLKYSNAENDLYWGGLADEIDDNDIYAD